jgi:hypothetical protein
MCVCARTRYQADLIIAIVVQSRHHVRNDRGTARFRRGVVLTAGTASGLAAGGSAQKSGRVESFTVRLEHTFAFGLRCGFTPTFIIHSATVPCRYVHTRSQALPPHTRAHTHTHTTRS